MPLTRRTILTLLLMLLPAACGAPLPTTSDPEPGAADRPRGLFVLGGSEVVPEIAPLDFIEGVTLRRSWSETNSAAGIYDFAEIDRTLAALQGVGKRMSLEIFAVDVPAFVLAQLPEADIWEARAPGQRTVRTAVPWSAPALEAWRSYLPALADHRVPLADGRLVRFADHPTVVMLDAPIVGLQGIRELSNTLVMHPGYSRARFVEAAVASVRAGREAFPAKFGFVAFFRMQDADQVNPLDQAVMDRMMVTFNGSGQPTLGFFQENLSDTGPRSDGLGLLLAGVKDRTYVVFQALTSWVNPFTDGDNVTSGQAAVGIEFAWRSYGATFVEIYLGDVRDPAQTAGLRRWNAILMGRAQP